MASSAWFGWDKDFVIDQEDTAGQATCEGRGFLPIILRVSSSLVASIQWFLKDRKELNWNISPRSADSF